MAALIVVLSESVSLTNLSLVPICWFASSFCACITHLESFLNDALVIITKITLSVFHAILMAMKFISDCKDKTQWIAAARHQQSDDHQQSFSVPDIRNFRCHTQFKH